MLPHKLYEKFYVVESNSDVNPTILINRENRLLDLRDIIATVATFPVDSRSGAEATCRLLNQAYSEGHARGIDVVFEGLRNAAEVDE